MGAIGLALGGWLINLGSWRAIFLINLPLPPPPFCSSGALSLMTAALATRRSTGRRRAREARCWPEADAEFSMLLGAADQSVAPRASTIFFASAMTVSLSTFSRMDGLSRSAEAESGG
jgi:MFS family permease